MIVLYRVKEITARIAQNRNGKSSCLWKYNYGYYNILYCQNLLIRKKRYKENNFLFVIYILRECQEIRVSKKKIATIEKIAS